MSHKDDINVLSGRLHRIIGQLCDLEEDLGIIYDELDASERTCQNVDDEFPFFKCSECGCNAVVGYGSSGDGLPNYCPECGCKVVSE